MVVKDPYVQSKRRLAVDYSHTINRFTLLDVYSLPQIDETVNTIAQYSVYSTINLRRAYHQVPIKLEDKPIQLLRLLGGSTSLLGYHLESLMVWLVSRERWMSSFKKKN